MRNISSKTDNVGDVLPASDFNANLRVELQSIITDCGLTLDPEGGPDSDLDMFGKSLTMYSNASQYYADTGAADAYVVDRVGNLQPLSSYVDGATICFKAANSNTGASTINVDGLGVVDLVDNSGSALSNGDILANRYIQARYNSSSGDFEIFNTHNSRLTTWENIGDDLLPVVSSTGTIGSTTRLIEGVYLGDSQSVFFGDDQDAQMYHTGTQMWCNCDGDINFVVTDSNNIRLKTNNTDRWLIDSSGHLLPFANATYNLGSATNGINSIYLSDSSHVYLGNDLDLNIWYDGTQSRIYGSLLLVVKGSTGLVLGPDGSTGAYDWNYNTTCFYPQVNNAMDIGDATHCIKTFYYYTLSSCSDERLKTDISDSIGLDFLSKLKPIAFEFKEERDKKRYGLSAQQVKEVINKENIEFSGLTYHEEEDRYNLDYTQFIGPIIQAIKELNDKIDK